MRKKLAILIIMMMTAAVFTGCGGSDSSSASSEGDVYMSQFGEYENGDEQSANTKAADGSEGSSLTGNGEMIFEEATRAESNDVLNDTQANTEPVKNDEKSSEDMKATAGSETVVVSGTERKDNATVANVNDSTESEQKIANPTENTASNDNSDSVVDYGSGVSQSCDDDNDQNGDSEAKEQFSWE